MLNLIHNGSFIEGEQIGGEGNSSRFLPKTEKSNGGLESLPRQLQQINTKRRKFPLALFAQVKQLTVLNGVNFKT